MDWAGNCGGWINYLIETYDSHVAEKLLILTELCGLKSLKVIFKKLRL